MHWRTKYIPAAAKKAIIAEFDWAEEAGYTLDSPDFKVFYLANAEATIYNSDMR